MIFSSVIDLTHTVTDHMPVCQYDEPVIVQKIRTLDKNYYNDYQIKSGMHVGTHIDGPGHLLPVATILAHEPIEHFVGPGTVLDVRGREINGSLLDGVRLEEGSIVLVCTGRDKEFGSKSYFENYPEMSEDFAQKLIDSGVRMVGMDSFSPDKYPFKIHKMLLENNILIIENLKGLEQLIGVGAFTVVALPLKIEADSALARVIALIN